jgi:hypothetical protein
MEFQISGTFVARLPPSLTSYTIVHYGQCQGPRALTRNRARISPDHPSIQKRNIDYSSKPSDCHSLLCLIA